MKARSYISLFLILCFSVFLGHSLVPHHHHAEHVIVPVSSDCPIDHEDEHHHGKEADADHQGHNHPLHCHAFNDVVFHKYTAQKLPEASRDITTLFVPLTTQETRPLSGDISSPFVQLKLPDKLLSIKGALSLRAPPFRA